MLYHMVCVPSQVILILYLKLIFNAESKIFQENIILVALFDANVGSGFCKIGDFIQPNRIWYSTFQHIVREFFCLLHFRHFLLLCLSARKGYAIFLFSSKNMIFFIYHSFGISISNSIFLSSSSNFPFRSIFKFWVILPRPCSNSTPGESDQT